MAFEIFGFPVKVDLSFFVVAAFLGMNDNVAVWLIWIAVVFVSVLVHELGHALAGRKYGLSPAIRLTMTGGLTSWSGGRRLDPRESIFVSFAGPAMGFAAGFLVLALSTNVPLDSPYLRVAVRDLLWVNFGWGIINLIPVLPLDGGNIVRSGIHLVRGRPDEITPLRVSVFVAVGGAFLALANGLLFAAILAGFLAFQNYQMLSARGGRLV